MDASRLIALVASAAGFGAAAWFASRRSQLTAAATSAAVAAGGTFEARLTGYWPFAATAAEKKMEGGVNDRKGRPLHTLEQHLADPSGHPYVAVSGDDAIFPYGQRVSIDEWPQAVFRVVDTGSHFRGARKVYRVLGREPLDVAVDSSNTRVLPEAAAKIFRGDHFDKASKEISVARFKGQDVAVGGGFDVFGMDAPLGVIVPSSDWRCHDA